jgi:hypothetical protein
MTSNLKVIDYADQVDGSNVCQGYAVETNCYWITITKCERGTGRETQEIVFERKPQMDEWLDEKHARITRAISELEEAVLAAVREKKKEDNS